MIIPKLRKLMADKPKDSKQLARAISSDSRFSIIVFPEEWKIKEIVIKDMQTQN